MLIDTQLIEDCIFLDMYRFAVLVAVQDADVLTSRACELNEDIATVLKGENPNIWLISIN